jgi:hypothetical protein
MRPFGEKPINFSLRVIATDLPVNDPNFKIKIAMDFVPDFISDTVRTNPNFNGKRVMEIMDFIGDDVIKKVIEFVYYDRLNEYSPKDQGDSFDKVIDVYEDRKKQLAKISKGDPKADEKKKAILTHREKEIDSIISKFLTKAKRKPTEKESNVANIRFEQFSAGVLTVALQTVVNGEKRPPNQ